MPRGYPDTVTCPDCREGQDAFDCYCSICGADLHHKQKPIVKVNKVEVKVSDGSRLILETGKKCVTVHIIQAPDWDEMVTEFPKDKFFKAIRRLNE
jgi:hypothetical protein